MSSQAASTIPLPSVDEVSRVMRALGSRGGSVRSLAKTAAARENAKRPRKKAVK